MPSTADASRLTLPRRMRLSGGRQFAAVYAAKARGAAGPLLLYARPNDLGFARLGLSVSRRVGRAVTRHRIKRLLREAFRLEQHTLRERWGGAAYDLVISVRAHEPLKLESYRSLIHEAAEKLHRIWMKRGTTPSPPAPRPPRDRRADRPGL